MNSRPGNIKLLVADDHRILLDGIASLLKTAPSFTVVDTATDGLKAAELVMQHDYDVCLLDISMPGMDGLELVRFIRAGKPAVKIIMLTTYNDKAIITEMIHQGVSGYLLKNSSRQELVTAIHKVLSGQLYFSDEVNEIILNTPEQPELKTDEIILTPREKQIVGLLAKEYTNDMIAAELRISYRTVETHRKNIMQKTKASNLAGLIRFAYSKGLIE